MILTNEQHVKHLCAGVNTQLKAYTLSRYEQVGFWNFMLVSVLALNFVITLQLVISWKVTECSCKQYVQIMLNLFYLILC